MAITSACGPHCGIRCNAEGTVTREAHCPCAECACPRPARTQASAWTGPAPEVPMCERWYERAGDSRPWEQTV